MAKSALRSISMNGDGIKLDMLYNNDGDLVDKVHELEEMTIKLKVIAGLVGIAETNGYTDVVDDPKEIIKEAEKAPVEDDTDDDEDDAAEEPAKEEKKVETKKPAAKKTKVVKETDKGKGGGITQDALRTLMFKAHKLRIGSVIEKHIKETYKVDIFPEMDTDDYPEFHAWLVEKLAKTEAKD